VRHLSRTPSSILRPIFTLSIFLLWHTGLAQLASSTATPVPVKKSADWVNPCSGSADPAKQLPDAVCRFLEQSFAEIDKRCGIVPVKRFWPPWNVFRPLHTYDIIPVDVLRGVKTSLDMTKVKPADTADFSSSAILSLVPLLTTVTNESDPSKAVAAIMASNDPGATLDFNPLTDPKILNLDAHSHSDGEITCNTALQANQSGRVKATVADVSEKFSAQSNSDLKMELVTGTFTSPIDYLANIKPSAQYFEALDLYRRNIQANVQPPTGPLRYISQIDGLVRYNTQNASNQSDVSGTGSASVGSLVGSVDASATADHSTQQNRHAVVFTTLLRNPKLAQLPSPASTKAFLSNNNQLFDLSDPNYKPTAFDKPTNTVKITYAMPGMPLSLCATDLWSVTATANGSLKADSLSLGMKPSPKPSSSSSAPSNTRRVCTATISVPAEIISVPAGSSSDPIVFTLSFKIDPTAQPNSDKIIPQTPFEVIKSSFRYTQPDPGIHPMNSPQAPTATSAQFWYQFANPVRLDPTVSPVLGTSPSLVCDGDTLSSPAWTATFATSFPSGNTNISGSFLLVQFNYTLAQFNSSLTVNPKVCKFSDGKVTLSAADGSPIKLNLQSP
jgi:hypothetical protein